MKCGIPGTTRQFTERTGGYINYLFTSQNFQEFRENTPGFTFEDHMHDEDEANQMLEDANAFVQKYFPWMKDFIIFQLSDGTVRLDAADRAFLGGD